MTKVLGRAKILEISSYPPPRMGWGVRISFVRQRLREAGHDCQVLNIGPSRKAKSEDYLDVQSGWDYLAKVWRHLRRGYLLHAHLNGDSPKGLALALAGELLATASGRRPVLTFHAGPIQRYFPKHRSRLFAPLYALSFLLPQRIICNSEPVRARILEYGVPASKIVSIPAFSREYLQYQQVAFPPKCDAFLRTRRPVIACYLFLRPEFFVPSFLEAMALVARQLPEMGVLLIGGETQSPSMSDLVEGFGLARVIHAVGDLPHDAFLSVLSRSHLVVRTPPKDGVCSSVLEALSLGIPVIASENGTRPPGVIPFKPNDAADLAQRVIETWSRYEAVRSALPVPEARETVEEEARLLVETSLGQTGKTSDPAGSRRP